MKINTSEFNEKPSIFTALNEVNDDDSLNDSGVKQSITCCSDGSNNTTCRFLTLTDIHQALNTIEIRQELSRKRANSPDRDISAMTTEQTTQSTCEYNCCRLVHSDKSSRLLLPLARRGRAHRMPSRSTSLLCKNCAKIKQDQQNSILQKYQQINADDDDDEKESMNIFDSITDTDKPMEQENKHKMTIRDIPHEIEFSLINDDEKNHTDNSEYESARMLIWKINTSNNHNQTNAIEASYDTGSLTNNEKKNLLQEAIQKLHIVLSNRSTSPSPPPPPTTTTTTTIPDTDLDEIEFTYRALQTTVNILSSSLESL
ncbi:unnamed protein product [Rotaria magnacalcarata]|uniref:Uncharacterized protein n=3 Tax=Rotaria magnacalcarata TaxID=392030 RepID=A0A816LS35_9BILA|nr:unnamed protein product [Rotaria magnacalcarata]